MSSASYDDIFNDNCGIVGGGGQSYTDGCCMVLDFSSSAMQALNGMASAKITTSIGRFMTPDQTYMYENETGFANWSIGFLDRLYGIIMKLRPSIMMVALDSRETNWRKDIYKDYKFGRKAKNKRLHNVDWDIFRKAKDDMALFLKNIGSLVIEVDKAEADDIIYCIARLSHNVVVVSVDGDMMQLAKWGAKIYNPKSLSFVEELNPSYFLEHKVIIGDSSDYIHSIRGTMTDKKSVWPSTIMKKSESAGILNYFADNKDENKEIELVLPSGVIKTSPAKLYVRNKKLIDMEYIPQAMTDLILNRWKEEALKIGCDVNSANNYNSKYAQLLMRAMPTVK